MSDADHILISLEPRYAESILERIKLVELRRRAMKVKVGATVWLYAKLPVGSIVGRATVRANHVLAPSTLWRRFGAVSAISRGSFSIILTASRWEPHSSCLTVGGWHPPSASSRSGGSNIVSNPRSFSRGFLWEHRF